MDARHLAKALAKPAYVVGLDARGWAALLAMADAERLTASLAWRLAGLAVPEDAAARLAEARASAEAGRGETLSLIRMIAERLVPAGLPTILMDGAAWTAAGLDAARGRMGCRVGIAIPAGREAEAAALLDPAVRIATAHADAFRDASLLENGLFVPSPEAMVMDAVAGLLAPGDPAKGLAGLWDIDRLVREFSGQAGFWQRLHGCSSSRRRTPLLSRALRLSHHLFGTPADPWLAWEARRSDVFYLGRILARDVQGRESRRILRLAFRLRARWRG